LLTKGGNQWHKNGTTEDLLKINGV